MLNWTVLFWSRYRLQTLATSVSLEQLLRCSVITHTQPNVYSGHWYCSLMKFCFFLPDSWSAPWLPIASDINPTTICWCWPIPPIINNWDHPKRQANVKLPPILLLPDIVKLVHSKEMDDRYILNTLIFDDICPSVVPKLSWSVTHRQYHHSANSTSSVTCIPNLVQLFANVNHHLFDRGSVTLW